MDTSKTIGIAFCLAFATSVVCKPVDINGGGSTNLVAVGSIEGKTFFADPTARFTFTRAGQLQKLSALGHVECNCRINDPQPQCRIVDFAAACKPKYTGGSLDCGQGLASSPTIHLGWYELCIPAYGAWTNHGNAYQTCGSLDPATGHRNMHLELCTTAHKVLCETIV
ncbi:hypothetical protein Ocin01_16425 [Orchesella cincta]|uniref:Uncharacterized protein n=1 Tax=Orchesella cincta TaxID=48709 RepID=A0A1D2MB87_ORCCI|nr:hypothetical protein Ocin01_16425 [Orchesella cincta]